MIGRRRAGEDRSPGWYPDAELARRFRLWDGNRWRRLTSSAPVWGPLDPTSEQAAALGRAMSPVAIAASVLLVVALLGGGIWTALQGEDGDQVASAGSAEVAGLTVERDPDAPIGTTPEPGAPAAPGPLPTAGAVQDCPQLANELTNVAKDNPRIRSAAATLTVTEVRCSASWASGEADSGVTPPSLAVFERRSDTWVLVGYGATGACSQLGLDPALAEALACN